MESVAAARFILALAMTAFPSSAGGQESPTAEFSWHDGRPSLTLGQLRLEFGGRVETDMRSATAAAGRDSADLRWPSPRIEIEGRLSRHIDFEVSRDLGDQALWRDAFADIRLARRMELRGGRFKIPYSREALTGRANLDFIYRSLGAAQLAPGRDVGAMLHGRTLKRLLRYEVGWFSRDGDNARTTQALGGGQTLAARLVAAIDTPLTGSQDESLQLGIAAVSSQLDNRLGMRGETVLDDGVFFDRVYVNGERRRFGLEAAWNAGRTSVTSEYLQVADLRSGMGFDGEDLEPVRASSWYLAGTWAITGESKAGRLEPRRPLTHHGPGAIELVARIERLRFSDVVHPGIEFGFPDPASLLHNADRVLTIGVNWYLNHYFRIQQNTILETIEDPTRSPAPGHGGHFTTMVIRLQAVL